MSNNRITNGVNENGKVRQDEQVKVRFQERNQSPFVVCLTNILNFFGNLVSPIKEKKPR